MSFIYLASPYSHPDPKMMQRRYDEACRTAARLMMDGHAVFAPIAHSHPIAGYMHESYRRDFELWMREDLPILRYASALWVLTLPGWEASRGVTREREYADQVGIPTRFLGLDEVFAERQRPPLPGDSTAVRPVLEVA